MTNEIQNVDVNTGEILQTEEVIRDTEDYTIVLQADGRYRKDMKYKKYYSLVPESKEDSIELYKILNSQDNEKVTPMAQMKNKEIEIHQVYTNPYQSFDENTGGNINGVTTTIQLRTGLLLHLLNQSTIHYFNFLTYSAIQILQTMNQSRLKLSVLEWQMGHKLI